MTKALITGITGQDGSYLAEFLLEKGYEVVGLVRRVSTEPPPRLLLHLQNKIQLVSGDVTDQPSLIAALQKHKPDEVYNLAAQSFVAVSWLQPQLTAEVTGLGVLKVLDAIRLTNPKIRFYQASSSEMFGKAREIPQNEQTSFHPGSPYAAAKAFGHWITVNYRESYGLFACAGICFNHESPRRGRDFVTRKVSHAVAEFAFGLREEPLELGNLESQRDWGFAGDYVRAMWLMLQQDKPDDYVIATGETHSVRDFVEAAFAVVDVPVGWEKEGLGEVGINQQNGKVVVRISEKFFRPIDPHFLLGDATKARKKLGWQPTVSFKELVEMMVKADLAALK